MRKVKAGVPTEVPLPTVVFRWNEFPCTRVFLPIRMLIRIELPSDGSTTLL